MEIIKNNIIFIYYNFFFFEKLELVNLNLKNNIGLLLLLEIISSESKDFEHINLSGNKCDEKVCDVIQRIIIKHKINYLNLSFCNITSKMLIIISIGIAKNEFITEVNFSDNFIGKFYKIKKFKQNL